MRSFIGVMKALSDPNRVKVMKMLGVRPLCVCEITAILGLAQPTVSKHLKVLEAAGMVESWKEGSWVNYRLPTRPDNRYVEEMLAGLQGWLADDPQIKNALVQVATVDRLRICAA